MKNKLLIILYIFIAVTSSAPVQAGFMSRKSAMGISAAAGKSAQQHDAGRKGQKRETMRAIRYLLQQQSSLKAITSGRPSASGWEGVVSLTCGIVSVLGSLFGLGLLAIPAIIFGAIGMGRGHVHRGVARAGFILGLVSVVISIIVVAIIISVLSGI